MAYLRITLVLFTLLPALFANGRQQRDSVLNRVISVNADEKPIFLLLEQISRENNLFFSYDATLINTEKRVTIHLENKTLIDVLKEIFKNDEFQFLGKNSHVIISAIEYKTQAPSNADSAKILTMLVLRGKVVDNSNHNPLSFASVSLLNRPLGTITNSDGDFILKLSPEYINDTIIICHLGYARQKKAIRNYVDEEVINLQSISIRIREIKVKAVSVEEILANFRKNILSNYSEENQLFTGFYRETVRQDEEYISVSEAVLEILKASYGSIFHDDKVHLLKARHSPDVNPFHWVNFKMQGGPYTITMLDVVKKMETFLDPEYELFYRYSISNVIWYKNHPAFVVKFRPAKDIDFPCFVGEMYIDRESYALLFARFGLDNYGLNMAEETMIKKKPKGFKVKPQYVNYLVDYSEHEGKWYLHTAQASVAFRVKSPQDKINAVYHSVSDLLITDFKNTDLRRFPVKSLFSINDIFAEMAINYDEKFWENYNIIKPDEDLEKAIKSFIPGPQPTEDQIPVK